MTKDQFYVGQRVKQKDPATRVRSGGWLLRTERQTLPIVQIFNPAY
jgi:hypothetical protein